ncbi:MAG: RNA methyltransferase [Candidatus Harrisonbacteria bacterium]|nr:RNA methyltransferase [Candidatus Harrisonbacteria bacterium]
MLVAILHNIRSLHNVGSIFRTADGAGVDKLYLGGITPSPLDRLGRLKPQFDKVALGSHISVPFESVRSTRTLIKKLKDQGYSILGLELASKAILYSDFHPKNRKLALIVGNEVQGLRKDILDLCDHMLMIPMRGAKESLNVSIAFGIVAYELMRHNQ